MMNQWKHQKTNLWNKINTFNLKVFFSYRKNVHKIEEKADNSVVQNEDDKSSKAGK